MGRITKVGFDDFFAARGEGAVAELEVLARPWSAEPPPLAPNPTSRLTR